MEKLMGKFKDFKIYKVKKGFIFDAEQYENDLGNGRFLINLYIEEDSDLTYGGMIYSKDENGYCHDHEYFSWITQIIYCLEDIENLECNLADSEKENKDMSETLMEQEEIIEEQNSIIQSYTDLKFECDKCVDSEEIEEESIKIEPSHVYSFNDKDCYLDVNANVPEQDPCESLKDYVDENFVDIMNYISDLQKGWKW